MHGQRIKDILKGGGRVVGTFFQYMTNPAIVEMLPDSGLDFVIVNCEHNALDTADFLGMQFALHTKGAACLARCHSRNPDDIAKICDSFHDGVVVPYVEEVDELRQMVAAAKMRPLKGPALQRVIESGEWPSEKSRAYVEEKCANTLFCAMIESVHAVDNLDAVCAVPGIDAVFVGPNDLTVSMGIPEERDNPEFIAIMQRIIEFAEKHGIAAGSHFSQIEHAQRLVAQGGRFIPYSSDARLIQYGVRDYLAVLKNGVDEAEGRVI